jgi:RNA polymerase sigma-70 factor (ECF subfamily)
VGKSEAACRQLAVRARRQIDADRPRFEPSRAEQEELTRRFMAAAETGDLDALEHLLAADVALHGDGGGKVRAITQPLVGRTRVARSVLGWMRLLDGFENSSIRLVDVNGRPGALGLDGQQRILFVLSLHIADGQIRDIRSVVNPDKLRHLGPVSDLLPAPPRRR